MLLDEVVGVPLVLAGLAPLLVLAPRSKKAAATVCNVAYVLAYILLYRLSQRVYGSPGHYVTLGLPGLGDDAFMVNSMTLYVSAMMLFVSHMILLHALLSEDEEIDALKYAAMLAAAGSAVGVMFSNNLALIAGFWEALIVSVVGVLYERELRSAQEATLKMLVMSLVGSVLMFLGIALAFVAAMPLRPSLAVLNLTSLLEVFGYLHGASVNVALASLVFMIAGMGIEVGLAPFHMWLPDVYSGARASSAAFTFTLEDMAGLWVLMRVLSAYSQLPSAPVLAGLAPAFIIMVILALLSMSVGELSALAQGGLRRMLGYSTVADAGYVLLLISYIVYNRLNVLVGDEVSYSAPVAYFIVFSVMSLTTALALMGVAEGMGMGTLDTVRGLIRVSPVLALPLVVSILSVAGAPPLAGFIAKFMMLSFLIGSREPLTIALGVIAALFFAVCAAYVLRVVQRACIEAPTLKAHIGDLSLKPLAPLIVLVVVIVIAGCVPSIVIPGV